MEQPSQLMQKLVLVIACLLSLWAAPPVSPLAIYSRESVHFDSVCLSWDLVSPAHGKGEKCLKVKSFVKNLLIVASGSKMLSNAL